VEDETLVSYLHAAYDQLIFEQKVTHHQTLVITIYYSLSIKVKML